MSRTTAEKKLNSFKEESIADISILSFDKGKENVNNRKSIYKIIIKYSSNPCNVSGLLFKSFSGFSLPEAYAIKKEGEFQSE
jgi:hypothetical protein